MTTLAYDGKSLCTDSLVSSNGAAFGHAQKLFKLGSGAVLAVSGSMSLTYGLMLWLDGRGEKPTLPPDGDICAILIDPSGDAWDYGKELQRFPACVPWAGGSGEKVALTAMYCGKTAREAIEIACELDLFTRGPIQEWTR